MPAPAEITDLINRFKNQYDSYRSPSVLDPACGSSSFLIGAYQHLLDWHRDWYVEHDPATAR